jgi:hypothetical protein
MYVKAERLLELGVSRKTIESKVTDREWEVRESETPGEGSDEILLSSLPQELQAGWAKNNLPGDYSDRVAALLSESSVRNLDEHAEEIKERLVNLGPEERQAWLYESLRMSKIVERYGEIEPKRRRDQSTGRLDFMPGVYELCRDTACASYLITSKRPHRSKVMSPFTLDGLYRAYRRKGLVIFLPKQNKKPPHKQDRRRAMISEGAVRWINKNWHRHTGPYPCYDKLKKEAVKHGWKIPSKAWFYRLWRTSIPPFIKTLLLEGKGAYIAKYEPYVPRDNSDLEALQVLCGDHSERDVVACLPNGSLARPWLTIWYDLRTGLIWGWHLSLVPSSHTAGLAYADGVRNFGAQPVSRPEAGFYSYVYTDRGRDYRSHRWDGKVINVHKEAMRLDGGLEWLYVQRRVGILDELKVKHLLAKGRNPKEKPVERIHKDISCWEANNFEEYCGRSPERRPDRLLELYEEHKRFERGARPTSPFIPFENYRERLAERITEYNAAAHQRPTLGSRKVVPVEEYRQLYTTRYKIDQETMTLLLMKAERRVIGKDGVQCFQKHWFYFDEAMSVFKGSSVEMRYSDEDYTKVFVVLPNARICEAQRINPSSLLNPNKETVKRIRKAKANEKKIADEFELLTQSTLRGETVEDRVARELEAIEEPEAEDSQGKRQPPQGRVHQLTRLDRARRQRTSGGAVVTSAMVSQVPADTSIFSDVPVRRIK